MPNTQVRVVGSGFSNFQYNGKTIAWLEQIQDSGQKAWSDAGLPYQFIQPIGARTPKEIATSRVLQGGTLQLTIRELWNTWIWEQLAGLAGSNNIVDIFDKLAANPAYVTCSTIITPPGGAGKTRGKVFQQCTVVDIDDSDTITVGALAVAKNLTVAYCYSTPLGS